VNRARKLLIAGCIGIITSALLLGTAQARMYQWQSSATGSVQFSGEPPAWYRATQSGPRIRVYDGGNLVDDTAIALPDSQREGLRADAFRESEQRQRAEALKRLERVARQQQRRRAEKERLAKVKVETEQELARQLRAEAVGVVPKEASELSTTSDESLDDATVSRLKAMISEFDRRNGGKTR
jgi:hypothetical protein